MKTATVFMFAVAAAGAFAAPKTIVFGWDTGRITVSKMLEKADGLSGERPFEVTKNIRM